MTHVPDSPPTLAKLLELLSKLIELISASFRTPAPAPPPRRPVTCSYCSSPRHLIRHCPRVLADIRSGLCKRNALGRVVLPSGLYVPHTVVGHNLRARFLAHTRSQQLRTPLVVRRSVPIAAPRPVPPSTIPSSYTPPTTTSAHRLSRPRRFLATFLPLVMLFPAFPTPRIVVPAPSPIEASSTAPSTSPGPSSLVPPPDPLEDVFRELALLRLHPDPLRLSALECRMAELRDSS
ncbi:hypothetical protein R3P38DRAFT_3041686 [Favolaschia claudopus]|uniref:Uncharacterized protein n=1 Tax=Favolaschia claudopus TaxID=2862362 RepID=A0AAW0A8T9_9AGAR